MKDLPKKIKVKIDGVMYELPSKVVTKQEHSVIVKIQLSSKSVALLLRQYLKRKYPQYVGYVNSEQYAGGTSVRMYVTTKDGYKISDEDYDTINLYARSFVMGTFDGSTDSYDYTDNTRVTSLGNEVESYVSYMFVYNKPKDGTLEWAYNQFVDTNHTVDFISSLCSTPSISKKFENIVAGLVRTQIS